MDTTVITAGMGTMDGTDTMAGTGTRIMCRGITGTTARAITRTATITRAMDIGVINIPATTAMGIMAPDLVSRSVFSG